MFILKPIWWLGIPSDKKEPPNMGDGYGIVLATNYRIMGYIMGWEL